MKGRIVLFLFALPFHEAVGNTTFLNAYVEMVSALTTTGATLFPEPGRLAAPLHTWRATVGWLGGLFIWVGAIAVLGGRGAVFATIESVETFVVAHYDQQISRLAEEEIYPEVALALDECMRDEDHHREDAKERQDGEHGLICRIWQVLVESGSAVAVVLARVM